MKKSYARVVSLLLAAAMLFGLAACSSDDDDNGDDGAAESPASSSDFSTIDLFPDLDPDVTVSTMDWYRGDINVYQTKDGDVTKKTPDGTIVFGGQATVGACFPSSYMMEFLWAWNVYETLIMRDTVTGEFYPWLATDYGYDDDGNLNITLREGVQFHSGGTMTAEDVLFSFEYAAGDNVNAATEAAQKIDFENSVIHDDYNLTIVFSEPCGSFLYWMSSSFLAVMSKDYVEEMGPDHPYLEDDAGTGPYYIIDSTAALSQTFLRFEDYWGDLPEFDTVIYKRYEDKTSQFVDYQNGEIDFCFLNTYDNVSRILGGEGTDTIVYQPPNGRIAEINLTTIGGESPFEDLRVRQALAYCINYEELMIGVNMDSSMATLPNSYTPEGIAYAINLGTYEYNPEKAIELLEDAGYGPSNPVTVSIVSSADPGGAREIAMEIIQAYAAEVGINVEINTVRSSELNAAVSGPTVPAEYDMTFMINEIGPGDPAFRYRGRAAYDAEIGTFSGNKGIDDEEFSRLVAEGDSTLDEEERAEIYAQLQELMYENCWTIPLYLNTCVGFCRTYIEGTNYFNAYTLDWASWTLAE